LKLARCKRALQCFTVSTSTPDMMIRQGRKLRRRLRTKCDKGNDGPCARMADHLSARSFTVQNVAGASLGTAGG
jgi:hypothetical protein